MVRGEGGGWGRVGGERGRNHRHNYEGDYQSYELAKIRPTGVF